MRAGLLPLRACLQVVPSACGGAKQPCMTHLPRLLLQLLGGPADPGTHSLDDALCSAVLLHCRHSVSRFDDSSWLLARHC